MRLSTRCGITRQRKPTYVGEEHLQSQFQVICEGQNNRVNAVSEQPTVCVASHFVLVFHYSLKQQCFARGQFSTLYRFILHVQYTQYSNTTGRDIRNTYQQMIEVAIKLPHLSGLPLHSKFHNRYPYHQFTQFCSFVIQSFTYPLICALTALDIQILP